MSGTQTQPVPVTRVAFDIKTFFTLLGIIVAGVATTVASLYSIQLNMKTELADMDRRWIERTAQVEERVRADLNALRETLPGTEVKNRLNDISERLARLESFQMGHKPQSQSSVKSVK